MSGAQSIKTSDPTVYQIKLKGHLGQQWASWFEDLSITLTEDGNTILCGEVKDQAALHGVFKRIRNLGITLISVNPQSHGN